MRDVFTPAWGSTQSINNDTAATAAVVLPKQCTAVLLTNTSTTARVHVMLTDYFSEGDVLPTGTAPTTTTGLPILPNDQIAVYVGQELAVIRTIATAADGALLVTPGNFV